MSAVHYTDDQVTLHQGDALAVLRTMPDASVDCVVTSPPYYGLRDYGEPGQYGLEPSPAEYVETMRAVFAEVRRVLAPDGTLWLNLGDSYARDNGQGNVGGNLQGGGRPSFRRDGATACPSGRRGGDLPNKNLLGIPWRVAFALQDDGWILRNAIVWDKPNAMPESVTDRLATTYETVFMFARSPRYWFDLDAVREPLTGGADPTAARKASRAGAFARAGDGVNAPHSGFLQNGHPQGRNPGDVWELDVEPLKFPAGVLTADEVAYIAGFVDGEGSICIRRRTRQIQLMLTVVNTHEGVIRWLCDRTGMGQVRQREVRNEKWRQVWEWCVTSRQAAQVIYAVLPALRVKVQQALLALHFMETTRRAGGGSASAAYHDRRHAMAEDLAALNAGRISVSKFAVDPVQPEQSSRGDVWTLPTSPFPEAHFAVMAAELARRCIVAGCKPGGTVLDPFAGSGTTGMVALKHGRRFVGIDLSATYLDLALRTRLAQGALIEGGAP